MEFVYANSDGFVRWGESTVRLNPGEVWWADDPFVVDRPDLFSSTPPTVHGTTGRPHPDPTPIEGKRGRKPSTRG